MLEHPLHPMFVHFTVALTLTGVVTYLLSNFFANTKWKSELIACATWMIVVAAAATVITLITGFLQFASVSHDAGSHLAMVNHRNWAIGTSIFLLFAAIWSVIRYVKAISTGILFPVLLLGLLGVVATTAYKGGSLVYNYGLGVKSNPELRKLLKKENGNHHENIFNIEDSNGSDGHNHEH